MDRFPRCAVRMGSSSSRGHRSGCTGGDVSARTWCSSLPGGASAYCTSDGRSPPFRYCCVGVCPFLPQNASVKVIYMWAIGGSCIGWCGRSPAVSVSPCTAGDFNMGRPSSIRGPSPGSRGANSPRYLLNNERNHDQLRYGHPILFLVRYLVGAALKSWNVSPFRASRSWPPGLVGRSVRHGGCPSRCP